MSTVGERLDLLEQNIISIRETVENKGVPIPIGTPLSEWSDKINLLPNVGDSVYIGDFTNISNFTGKAKGKVNSGRPVIGLHAVSDWTNTQANTLLLPDAWTNVNTIEWSPDNRYLIIGLNQSPWYAMYDWITGSPVRTYLPSNPSAAVTDIKWSVGSKYLAIAQSTGYIPLVYNWTTGNAILITGIPVIPAGTITTISWTSDEKYLAIGITTVGTGNYNFRVIDFSSEVPVFITPNWPSQTTGINCVRWSPNNRHLIILRSTYLDIWDWASGPPTTATSLSLGGTGAAAEWSPDGRYLAVTTNTTPWIAIYDWTSGSPAIVNTPAIIPPQYTARPGSLTWSPDGEYLIVAHDNTPYITIYNWKTGLPVATSSPTVLPTSGGRTVGWSPNGKYLVVGATTTPGVLIYNLTTNSTPEIREVTPFTLGSFWNQPIFEGLGISLEDIEDGEEGTIHVLWEE